MKLRNVSVVVAALLGSTLYACSSDNAAVGTNPEAGAGGGNAAGTGGSGKAATGGASTGGTAGGAGGTGGATSGKGGATTTVDAGDAGVSTGTDGGNDASSNTDATTGTGGNAGADSGGDGGPATTQAGDLISGFPPATTSIGAAGGTLQSGDGQLLLTIPAGALTTATALGIQTVTNNAPGGTGYAYRLTPDGQQFTKPVTLAFKPSYGQLEGSSINHVKLAFQDATGRWQLIPVTADVGTGTATATTTHFTDYAYLLDLALSGTDALLAGKATTLRVIEVPNDAGYAGTARVASTGNPTWLLDGTALGNGSDGTLDPLANDAAYTAPAQIPTTNPVAVSVSFTATGGAKVTLVQDIHILAHKYRLDVTLTNDPICAGGSGFAYNYSTTGSIDLSLDDSLNITSSNPTAAATPTISAITLCNAPGCTATAEPAKTTGITLSTVTGGWEPAVHRLKILPRGNTSGSPSMIESCGQAGSHEIVANNSVWNGPGYVGFLQGKNGETVSNVVDIGSGTAGPSFKLTVVTP